MGLAKGRPLPQWAAEPPEIGIADRFALDSFYELASCRNGDGPIPWLAIVAYADRAGLDDDICDQFLRTIRLIDGAFLEQRARAEDQERERRNMAARRRREEKRR